MNPTVKCALDNPGLYLAMDARHPRLLSPLVSEGGKIYSVNVHSMERDRELAPEGFTPTAMFSGPLNRYVWLVVQLEWDK